MAVPKKRKSHSRTRMGRNHKHLKPVAISSCPRCGNSKKPHAVCDNCGHYRDRVVFDVEAETE